MGVVSLLLPGEVEFRKQLRQSLLLLPPLVKANTDDLAKVKEEQASFRELMERIAERQYNQYRDVLRFHLYDAEEKGDMRRAVFARERLKELEASKESK